MDEPVKTENQKGQRMPKSKNRRKNGAVVSGKLKKQGNITEGCVFDAYQLDDGIEDWTLAHGYEFDMVKMANDASDDEFSAYVDHLREGYRCAQTGKPWIYIYPR